MLNFSHVVLSNQTSYYYLNAQTVDCPKDIRTVIQANLELAKQRMGLSPLESSPLNGEILKISRRVLCRLFRPMGEAESRLLYSLLYNHDPMAETALEETCRHLRDAGPLPAPRLLMATLLCKKLAHYTEYEAYMERLFERRRHNGSYGDARNESDRALFTSCVFMAVAEYLCWACRE